MNKKGQTTVEFALTAGILFLFLFALIDFSVMFYVQLTMQHAVREGARHVITGDAGLNGDRRSVLVATIKEFSSGLYDKNINPQKDPTVNVVTPTQASFANYSGSPVIDTGKPNDIVIVSLTYTWPLLTPVLKPFFRDGNYTFTVKTTMKNEAWGV